MQIVSTEIPEVKVITPARHGDNRGFFSETYNRRALAEQGIDLDFVQDNHSYSAERGTVRGLHFQLPPFTQDKLMRALRGALVAVALDVRRSSPTFGQHVTVRLSTEEWNQLLIPQGFAAGFCTVEADTELLYKVTAYYAPEHDRGVLWNDPALAIDWPVDPAAAVLSDRDRTHPTLAEASDLL